MGYGATFSDDQRGADPARFDLALADWKEVLAHPEIAVHVDGGGRASAHRRDVLLLATADLGDRRLQDNLADLGVTPEVYEQALVDSRRDRVGVTELALTPGQDVVAASSYLRSLGGRRPLRVGPDHVVAPNQGRVFGPASPPQVPPSVPSARATGAQAAKAKRVAAPVKVAVIDTGYIAGDPLTDACTASAEDDTRWDAANGRLTHWVGGHGTHAAGVLAAAAGGAVRIHHYNVSSRFGTDGLPLIADSDVAVAVARALRAGCRILNLSLGGPTAGDLGLVGTSLAVAAAAGVRRGKGLQRDDAVVVASAGNEATTQPMFPAALKGVIGVGAVGATNEPAPFSNHGWWVDCAAVGVNLLGPYVHGLGGPKPDGSAPDTFAGWAMWSGTSFAAPFVAGRIAAAMAGPAGIPSARVAAATVLAGGTPLDPAFGLGVLIA